MKIYDFFILHLCNYPSLSLLVLVVIREKTKQIGTKLYASLSISTFFFSIKHLSFFFFAFWFHCSTTIFLFWLPFLIFPLSFLRFASWVPTFLLYLQTPIFYPLLILPLRPIVYHPPHLLLPEPVWGTCRRAVSRWLLGIWIPRIFANWQNLIELFVVLHGLILSGKRNCLLIITFLFRNSLGIFLDSLIRGKSIPCYAGLIPLTAAQRYSAFSVSSLDI